MSQKKKCQCYGPTETRRDPTLQVRKPKAGVFKSPRWFSYAGRPQPLSMETTLSNSVGFFWCLTSFTHCLVLVFNKSYIFKHSSKFWGCCHKEERHRLWVSCCPIRRFVSPCLISFALSPVSQLSMRMASPGEKTLGCRMHSGGLRRLHSSENFPEKAFVPAFFFLQYFMT